MIQKNIKIQIPTGLEARPVAVLVQIASKYESSIFIESGTKKVNAKSIMGMMALGLEADEEITVIAEGMQNFQSYGSIDMSMPALMASLMASFLSLAMWSRL